MSPWTRPSAMNGTRTNQFDAPTSFITSISRRRANVASRIVLTIRNSDDTNSTTDRPMKISRAVFGGAEQTAQGFLGRLDRVDAGKGFEPRLDRVR